jgi:hypothetical protein
VPPRPPLGDALRPPKPPLPKPPLAPSILGRESGRRGDGEDGEGGALGRTEKEGRRLLCRGR